MRRGMTVEERIADLAMPVPFSGCHYWMGAFRRGYPALTVDGKRCRVNRVALELKLGRKLERHEFALHSCDNPECVNPDHLSPGTHQENVDDKCRKGRQARVPNGGVRMNHARAEELRERKRRGESTPSLAKAFGISEFHVRRTYRGDRWAPERVA